MRVMLDTNVLLSAALFPSSAMERVVGIASSGDNELLLSTFVIEEAREVVARKWPTRVRVLDDLLLRLGYETVVTPLFMERGAFEIRDPKDYPVLYSAIVGGADVLVTGDKDFLDVAVATPVVMTPADFVSAFGGA